ncbi:MAG: hypothetical protein ABR530_11420 [Pyrinomonadaceae bacterium]
MKRYIGPVLFLFSLGIIAGGCFGQKPDVPDPRLLAQEFEDAVRGNHQPGGFVVVSDGCTKEPPGLSHPDLVP